jgi:hypothetical protein
LETRTARVRVALMAGLLLPPFAFLGWLVAGPLTIGNDYLVYPVQGAQSFRFLTGEGLEPMWYPHTTGGIPIGGLFFAQYFHWPAWLASHAPGFWTGGALQWISLRHLVLLGVAQALFYSAFRRGARLGPGGSYLLSFACVYQMRNLDAVRYGTGIDGVVYAQAVVLLGMLHVLRPSRVLLALGAVASQLLLTCGYPVAIPFVALTAILALPVLSRVVGLRLALRRGLEAVGATLVGFLLAAPNWLALTEWLSVNETRVAKPTLEWAGAWTMRPSGLLDNLFCPWRADVTSAFGGSTLLVLLLATLVVALGRRARAAWPLLLALAFPFAYAVGQATPLFPFFFAHVPGFSFLRVPGRSFVMLPLLLVLSVLWLQACRREGEGEPFLEWETRAAALLTIALGLGWLSWLALVGPVGALPEYCPATLGEYWTPTRQSLWLALGLVAAVTALRARASRPAFVALILATAVQTGMIFRHGTWRQERPRTPTREDFRRVSHLPLYGENPLQAINEPREESDGTATTAYARFVRTAKGRANCFLPILRSRGDRGVLLPFYLSDRVECVASREAALARLRSGPGCLVKPAVPAVLLAAPCPSMEPGEDQGAGAELAGLNQGNRVRALTTNVFTLDVDTPREAILVTPIPDATANWTGWLDGTPAPLLGVDGAFLGLRVPAGRHSLSLRYFSTRIVLGYRIAFATALALAAVGLVRVAGRGPLRPRVRSVLAAGLVVALAGMALPTYLRWETSFEARARKEATLNHNYPDLLARQLERWRGSSRAVVTDGEVQRNARGSR